MRLQAGLASFAAAALAACSPRPGPAPIPTHDAGADGGDGGGGAGAGFTITPLDTDAPGATSLAISAAGSKIGVAYFVQKVESVWTPDGGFGTYELRYVEPGSAPELVATVHNDYGVSLAFTSQGKPVIAYLGGQSNNGTYWLDSDLAIATRNGTSWTSVIAQGDSLPGDNGNVVGLYPALAIGPGDQIFAAHRDVHYGQFPVQDWERSSVGIVQGAPSGFTASLAVDGTKTESGDNVPKGSGGLNSLVLANGAPAIAWSLMASGPRSTPTQLWFTRQKNGAFDAIHPTLIKKDLGDAVAGPSLAWHRDAGYGIACEDRAARQLYYFSSADGDDWTSVAPQRVSGLGTSGWWPSLAFDPDGLPNIAFFNCSNRAGVAESACDLHELVLATQPPDQVWSNALPRVVDAAGGYLPRLAYVNGKAAIAYKSMDAKHTTLELALEK
jgi:hypothetical protein